MLKTKIAITKWIKSNFKNEHDFYNFLEYDYLNLLKKVENYSHNTKNNITN